MLNDRIVVSVPGLSKMTKARSSRDLYDDLGNDELWDFSSLVEELTGNTIGSAGAEPPEAWTAVRRLISALGQSTGMLNLLLALEPSSDPQAIARLQEWLRQYQGSDLDLQVQIAHRVLAGLLQLLARGDGLPRDGGLGLRFVTFHREALEPDPWAGETYDVFISYKHSMYRNEAEYLYNALTKRGLKCWLDRHELAINTGRIADSKLTRKLRYALQAAQCTLFFETVAEATVDANFRGRHTAKSWQAFEHRNANDLMYVRSTPRHEIELNWGGRKVEWRNLDDVVDVVQLRSESWQGQDPRASDGRFWAPVREPDLSQAVTQLGAAAEEYFEASIEVAPLAALALLAPGDDEHGYRPALASDVFVFALRYDPFSALVVEHAGLDLYKLFAVGTTVNNHRWSAHHSRLLTDLFGSDPGSPFRQRIAQKGKLDSRDVLRGIIEAGDANSFGSELLTSTLRYMHGATSNEEVHAAREQLSSMISQADVQQPPGAHGWLFLSTEAGWRTHPVVTGGRHGLAPQPGLPDTAAVLCRQSRRVYPDELVAELDELVNGELPDHALDRLLTERPELALTFSGRLWVSQTLELLPGDETPMFLYNLNATHRAGEHPAQSGSVTGSKLRAALQAALATAELIQYQDVGGPFHDRRPQPAVLLAGHLDGGNPTDRLLFLTLCTTVLRPLWEYQSVRDLDFDDF
jgi:hypothetical protein